MLSRGGYVQMAAAQRYDAVVELKRLVFQTGRSRKRLACPRGLFAGIFVPQPTTRRRNEDGTRQRSRRRGIWFPIVHALPGGTVTRCRFWDRRERKRTWIGH